MPIYRCPGELPEKLPAYLAGVAGFDGASVTSVPRGDEDESGAFKFVIRRGEVEVKLHGGRDAGGVHAMIMGGSLERRLAKLSSKLYRDVEEALMAWGARSMDGVEIAKLDDDW